MRLGLELGEKKYSIVENFEMLSRYGKNMQAYTVERWWFQVVYGLV